jgi:trigger factor
VEITETKAESLRREFKIVVAAADIEEQVTGRLREVALTVRIDGFRPGKVPLSILKERYGPSIIGEVLEKVVDESSSHALEERGLRPAMRPKIEIVSFEDGLDLEYTMEIEVMPDIEPMDFSKIKLERLVVETDEATIEEALANLAQSRKTTEALDENRNAKAGDVAVIDFVGSVDGEEFPGGKAEGYELELGSGSFIPGFEDQIIGAAADEKRRVEVSFPADYGADQLAGKDAVFEVHVKELRRTVPAAVDDDLAKQVGLETLGDLKSAIREDHVREFKSVSRMRLKRQVLDALDADHDFELPAAMVEAEAHSIWHQYEDQRKAAKEAGQAEDPDAKSDDELKAMFDDLARRRVRLGLLLGEIGRINNIQINQDDMKRVLAEETRRHPGQEQAILSHYQNSPEALESLRAPAFEEKVVDFILEMATITDKPATVDELMMDPDEEAAPVKKPKKRKAAKKKTEKKSKPRKVPAKSKAQTAARKKAD